MPQTNHSKVEGAPPMAMRDALLEKIYRGMRDDNEIFFISADFGSPVLDKIRNDFPERFINVGIAEQNLINISSGLALEGFKVFAYAIAPFITMRCYEQIRVNLALMMQVRPINVNLIGVGAGYSYVVSGPTHQCYEDLTIIGALPNVQILSPSDHPTAASLFSNCVKDHGIRYIRLDAQVLPAIDCDAAGSNGFRIVEDAGDLAIVATGYCTHSAMKIRLELEKSDISCSVVDLFDFDAINRPGLAEYLAKKSHVISLEEGFEDAGGLDTKIRKLCSNFPDTRFLGLGVSNGYNFELGTREELHEAAGIGPVAASNAITNFVRGH
ncbi:transketolase [bacterium]|nr:transketolase [bacterium]